MTFSATGNRGGENAIASIRSSIAARAGSISGEWNAPATGNRTARTFRSFAIASARSIAGTEPEITDLHGRVLVRDDEHVVVASLVAQCRGVLRPHAEERRHRARSLLAGPLHRGAAHDHEVERVVERHDARRDQRGELTERMSRDADDRNVLRLQHAERRDVAREHRRLDELGRRERVVVVTAGDDVSAHRIGRLVEDRLARGMRRPGIGHALELRPLSREHERRSLGYHGRRA